MLPAMTEPTTHTGKAAARDAAATRDREERRIGAPRAIADLVPRIGEAAFRRFGFVQSSVVSRWEEIVGARHARLSAPDSIRFPAGRKDNGTLSLTVSAGYGPIIQHVVPEIIERVNRFFGYEAVAKVSIKQGDLPVREETRRPPPANLRPLSPELGDSLRDIGDPELRAVLEAMAQGLEKDEPSIGRIS